MQLWRARSALRVLDKWDNHCIIDKKKETFQFERPEIQVWLFRVCVYTGCPLNAVIQAHLQMRLKSRSLAFIRGGLFEFIHCRCPGETLHLHCGLRALFQDANLSRGCYQIQSDWKHMENGPAFIVISVCLALLSDPQWPFELRNSTLVIGLSFNSLPCSLSTVAPTLSRSALRWSNISVELICGVLLGYAEGFDNSPAFFPWLFAGERNWENHPDKGRT